MDDQEKAYIFVGKYIHSFQRIEEMINGIITEYFITRPEEGQNYTREIVKKNADIISIVEYSLLSSKFFTTQLRIDVCQKITQNQLPNFSAEWGGKFFDLISKLQLFRNTIAHLRIIAKDDTLVITKRLIEFKVKQDNKLPSGILPPKEIAFNPYLKNIIVTTEMQDKIFKQANIALEIFQGIGLATLPGRRLIDPEKQLIQKVKAHNDKDGLYSGGVFKLVTKK